MATASGKYAFVAVSGSSVSAKRTLAATPESASVARSLAAAFVLGGGAGEQIADRVRLAVTEAATNAIRHARRHGGAVFDLPVEQYDDGLEITVADRGRGLMGRNPQPWNGWSSSACGAPVVG